ncbi:proto-oncogene tyrosine-protein kinase receptor Ret-like [Antedon mediterranea]|uniref:proto-oncogene tyrosine-protein kinase receptor Ret-like n=1 Tax=Antedon mediterranea TaxID=105859 RepID=UPI003AF441FB
MCRPTLGSTVLLLFLFHTGISDEYVNTTFPPPKVGQTRQGYCPSNKNSFLFSKRNVVIIENRLKGSVPVSLNITGHKTRNCIITPTQLDGHFVVQYANIHSQKVLQLVINKTIPYSISLKDEISLIVRPMRSKMNILQNYFYVQISIEELQMALLNVPLQQRIVYKKSMNYSRIFQSSVTDVIKQSSSNLKYRLEILEPSSLNGSLNITPNTAIVYVQNDYLLSRYPYRKPKNISFRIFVEDNGKQWKFENVVKLKGEIRKDHCPSQSCSNAEHNRPEFCNGGCGLGSNGSGCVWTVAKHFISCSSNPSTCPDNVCDELESMHFDICPQDCVDSNFVGDRLFVNTYAKPPSGKGIGRMPWTNASLCICNSNPEQCVCRRAMAPVNVVQGTSQPPELNDTVTSRLNPGAEDPVYKPNVLTSRNNYSDGVTRESPVCGALCQILIISGCLLVCLVVLIVLWQSGCIKCLHRGFHKLPFGAHVELQMTTINANYAQNEIFYRIQDIPPTIQQYKLDCDPKWEFPRSNLLFQDILGEGEFGRVVKAQALNIRGHTGYKTVAVKMLKPCATDVDMRDLVTELNLLKQVNNPNVIRLLGSCTQKGPLLVIVEYCENGSLRKFLRENRKRPIYSDHTLTPNSERSLPFDEFGSHSNTTTLRPRDLLSFAWQICKGMHYLSTLKLVHRDLAARNVLVGDCLVIKISDFGLMRDIYEADSYKRTSKGRIPVKWIAIESLYDNVYTAKSDVWSFAILLWEIVTMGATPYPGVTSERLYNILKTGYRMKKPDGCSDELYQIMTRCWSEKPMDRPSFQELCEIFENMLKRNIEYLDLTELQNLTHNEVEEEEEEEEDNMEAVHMVKMRLLNSNIHGSSSQSSSSQYNIPRIEKINESRVGQHTPVEEESYLAC